MSVLCVPISFQLEVVGYVRLLALCFRPYCCTWLTNKPNKQAFSKLCFLNSNAVFQFYFVRIVFYVDK